MCVCVGVRREERGVRRIGPSTYGVFRVVIKSLVTKSSSTGNRVREESEITSMVVSSIEYLVWW